MNRVRFLTAGESHGQALTVVLEGMVAGLSLSEDFIAVQLARRQKGYGRGPRMEIEKDYAEILSGVRHGLTLGSPITLLIRNRDWENWTTRMAIHPVTEEMETVTRLRPGHADFAGTMKYYQDDVRNILERASARETAARVAAGSICRRFLEEFGVSFNSHVVAIGGEWAEPTEDINWGQVEASPVRCADASAQQRMIAQIEAAREAGDTVGGVVEVIVEGVPIGLGSHVQWDRKLDAQIAQALLSINAVKAVGIGSGVEDVDARGSRVHDIIEPSNDLKTWRRRSNRAGGIEGGMSNGESIRARFYLKPISTLANPLPSVDLITGETIQAHYERSDVCVVPAAGVVGEAMMALILADAFLEKHGGDHLQETRRNYESYMRTLGPRGRRSEA